MQKNGMKHGLDAKAMKILHKTQFHLPALSSEGFKNFHDNI
jgi:hypothetical protein